MESITSDIERINISGITHLFPKVVSLKLNRLFGAVDLLVEINFTSVHLTVWDRSCIKGDLCLLKSMCGSGWVLDGRHPKLMDPGRKISWHTESVNHK